MAAEAVCATFERLRLGVDFSAACARAFERAFLRTVCVWLWCVCVCVCLCVCVCVCVCAVVSSAVVAVRCYKWFDCVNRLSCPQRSFACNVVFVCQGCQLGAHSTNTCKYSEQRVLWAIETRDRGAEGHTGSAPITGLCAIWISERLFQKRISQNP